MREAKAILIGLGISCAIFGPVQADEFPGFYAVTKVERSDRLNLRDKPDPKSLAIGSLAPDAVDVEVTELSRDGSWGRVNQDDRSAWVAMRFLERQDSQPWWDAAVPLSCYGTEPFWGLKLTGNEAQFDSPNGPEPVITISERAGPSAPDLGPRAMLGLRIGDGFAIIRSQTCSDGMSDRANGLAIDLFRTSGGALVGQSGCCSLQR